VWPHHLGAATTLLGEAQMTKDDVDLVQDSNGDWWWGAGDKHDGPFHSEDAALQDYMKALGIDPSNHTDEAFSDLERRGKYLLALCINCGVVARPEKHQPNTYGLCSPECEQQWWAFLDKIGDDAAVEALIKFGTKWPNISAKQFKHLATISARMDEKHPHLWPYKIEISPEDCWIFQRKDWVCDECKAGVH
jgi:hypothetical protein